MLKYVFLLTYGLSFIAMTKKSLPIIIKRAANET